MKKVFFAGILLCLSFVGVQAQSVPRGSKIFIAPMEGNLNGFITAEILKQHLQVVVVTDGAHADYVMTGLSLKEDNHWYNSVWGGKDKNEGSVSLIKVQDKTVVWATDAGDRTMLFSGFHRGGLSKVAERIVKQMKHQIAKH